MKHILILLSFIVLFGCRCMPQQISVQVLEADSNCQAILPDYAEYLSVKENCSDFVITQQPDPGTILNASVPYVTVYLFVTDDAGNMSEVSFEVILLDNTPPVITINDSLLVSTLKSVDIYRTYLGALPQDNILIRRIQLLH